MFRSALALLALTATASLGGASAQATTCTRNGTVLAGDTCDAVSMRYAISTYQLAQANPSIDAGCTNLAVGQEVCLALQGTDCSSVYDVKSGDTCQQVADAFGIPLATLYANNPQVDAVACANIYVGEVLCVASSAYPYPAAAATASSTSSAPSATVSVSASQQPAQSDSMTYAASATVASSSSASASAASASATSPASGLEYCADDDTSPDCVDEDELPYCDEV